ncbi:hypothetical protein KPL70_026107 [Citrus sinensis]|nr:hypothetical protein KPL70_026107 [Citrus sinensis]
MEWLTKTFESCSVVAALITTVVFATSAIEPGGVDQESCKPFFENELVFNVFAISSPLALCFSVTAFFYLTTLFTSIAGILISFCSGHSFILKDEMRFATYPIYAAACLPMTLLACAQLPLYFDLIWAIFKKVPQHSYKVISD